MATLQKFKLLATQCAVAASPTRSPATSPVIQLRRRKTLRMLLGSGAGRWFPGRRGSSGETTSPEMVKELSMRNKLKDLFVLSSPPALEENVREGLLPTGGGEVRRGGGARLLRPLSATLRQRLLRRAWRPVLVSIPE